MSGNRRDRAVFALQNSVFPIPSGCTTHCHGPRRDDFPKGAGWRGSIITPNFSGVKVCFRGTAVVQWQLDAILAQRRLVVGQFVAFSLREMAFFRRAKTTLGQTEPSN